MARTGLSGGVLDLAFQVGREPVDPFFQFIVVRQSAKARLDDPVYFGTGALGRPFHKLRDSPDEELARQLGNAKLVQVIDRRPRQIGVH